MSELKPHSGLFAIVRAALSNLRYSNEQPNLSKSWMGRDAANALNNLEEQQETLVRVANAAIAYCSDLNNRGEANKDDLEAAIAALYPASDPLGLKAADADLAAGRAQLASEVFAELGAERDRYNTALVALHAMDDILIWLKENKPAVLEEIPSQLINKLSRACKYLWETSPESSPAKERHDV